MTYICVNQLDHHFTPFHRRWNGDILDSPRCLSVRASVYPSVYRQGFRNFLKKMLAQFISYMTFTFVGWVSWLLFIFMFLASFSGLWWPNIWPKMGFPELKKNRYLYWIFLDEVGSDQSEGVLSPFMGTAFGSVNSLSPVWCQVITWPSADLLSTGLLSEIYIEIQKIHSQKMNTKMSSAIWQPFLFIELFRNSISVNNTYHNNSIQFI